MACLECGLEQAVSDAGICPRCGAPVTDVGHPSGTFTRRGGAELRVDSGGITTVGRGRKARAHLLSWDEIRWFRDGWRSTESSGSGWALHVVLANGRVEPVTEAWTAGQEQAPPELLALIRRAAAAHSIPAVLTGGQVGDGLPGKKPGLYFDPAGEPGLREWTGTEWSPFLQADPVASGHPDQETGLARIWSPLPAAELQRQSREVLRDIRSKAAVAVAAGAGGALFFALDAVYHAQLHTPQGARVAAGLVVLAMFCPVIAGCVIWHIRTRKSIALALSAAAIRALAQDDPPTSTAPPV
jgi:hypothetical protein